MQKSRDRNDPLGTADERLRAQLGTLEKKPGDGSTQKEKKRYSERVSEVVAVAVAQELRDRGLHGTRPDLPGAQDKSGAERRMSGGLGAKKVDVTWADDVSGLLLGISIKSINFRDSRTKNFQKNLTNRRGDMLFESVTLHRRFPYAVLFGLFFLDIGATTDGTNMRDSTFNNAHEHFALFTGRDDPAGRDEQYERLYIVLLNSEGKPPSTRIHAVGQLDQEISLEEVLIEVVRQLVRRNPDFYREVDGRLERRRGSRTTTGKRTRGEPTR